MIGPVGSSQLASTSLRELEAIFDHASIGIAFTTNRMLTRCNARMEALLGYASGALNGLPAQTIFQSPEDYATFGDAVSASLKRGRATSLEWTFVSRDGAKVICKINAKPVNSLPGDECTVWFLDDISEDFRQLQQLNQTTLVLQAVMNNAPVGILFTKDRRITNCNEKFREMFGFGEHAAIGVSGRELFPSDADYAEVGRLAAPLLSAGKPFSHEMPMKRQDGNSFWAHLIAYVLNPAQSSEGTIWLISDRSREKSQDEAVRLALLENQAILDNVVIGIVILKNRVVQRCNPHAEQLFGYEPGTMVGVSTLQWYANPAEYESVGADFYPTLTTAQAHTTEVIFRRRTGEMFWGRISGRIFDGASPLQGGSIWVIEDTSQRHAAEASLRNATALTGAVFNSANVSIIATSTAGTINLINATAQRWLGYSAEELVGRASPAVIHDPAEVVARAVEISLEMGMQIEPGFDVFVAKARIHGSDEREWTYIRKDGSRFPVHLSISALHNEAGDITGFIGIGVDITDRRRADEAIHHANEILEQRVLQRTLELENANLQLTSEIDTRALMEQEMRHMAHYDSLTGLPNRNLLNDRIEQAIEMAKRNNHKVGVLFIDLDHFKTINDTLGHHIGDLLLSQVASRMSFMLRATDTLGRLGGDEFLFLAPELDDLDKLSVIAAKFIEILAQPIVVSSHMLHVTPSIGVCCYPDHGNDRETLMRNADTAMYFAKASGRNNFKFYTERLNADVDSRFQIENALRYAEAQSELSLHYQPLMDMQSDSVFGLEALLRWNSKTLGTLSPAQFIPIAEESGLIIPIGTWVLRESCIQVKQWREAHGQDYMLAVNLSPQQFRQPDLVNVIASILLETGFPPSALELEITESSLMHNVTDVIATLHQLVALGVRLAIDDFGTGYSSLAYLRHFPVHKLKIDQSFVRDIGLDERGLGIVSTIISLSKTLGLEVIAEGVETQAQQDELTRQGCRFLQGYLFSRPMPVAETEIYLRGKAMQYRPT
jgi:diguanylate cyclase (GGDEF)-like protein/PAS domain S-box-containing protein